MKTLLFTVLLVAIAPLSSGADRQGLLSRMSGYEWDPTASWTRSLTAADVPVLLSISSDETLPRLYRERARSILVNHPADAVWSHFEALVQAADAGVERRRAVESLCAAFTTTRRDQVDTLLLPMLIDQDVHLRTAVSRCLVSSDNPLVKDAIARYRDTISEPWEMRAAGLGEQK